MLATLVVSGLVAVFVLRDPFDARIGAAIPTATVLGGYLIGRWGPRRIAAALPLRSVALGLVVLAAIVVGVRAARTLEAPSAARIGRRVIERVIGRIQVRTAAPEDLAELPDRRRYEGMVEYLRACTPPGSRVLTTWSAPHVHYFAQRGFAGGMPVTFGGHWNSAADQARTVEQFRSQAVPLVLVESESLTGFNAEYGRVADYLERNYRLAGVSSFGAPDAGPEAYRVMIRSSVIPAYTEPRWNLPCLVPRR